MIATVQSKTGIAVPPSVQRKAGFKPGDVVEFRASGGVITILPKLPDADDEYTPEQRAAIDTQLEEARKGPFFGPFDTAEETIAHMKRQLRKRPAAKRLKRSR